MSLGRGDFRLWITVPVRWGDMDALGHVNNARYFTYCESARIHCFAELGLGEVGGDAREGPIVVSATCNFRRQVRYPATLEVGTRVGKVGRTSFVLEYGLFLAGEDAAEETAVADGSSVVVWADYQAGRSLPLAEDLRTRLAELGGG